MKLFEKKLSINLIYVMSIITFLFPISLIFSRAFTEILVIFLSLLSIFYFKQLKFLVKSKDTKFDFFVILAMFGYLILNLFFSIKIDLSIERAIPFIRWFFFSLAISYFFFKISEENLNLFLKFLLIILVIQSSFAIFEFIQEQFGQMSIKWKLENTTFQSFEYRANGFFSDGKSGSYLSKFFLLPYLWILSKKKINIFDYLLIITILLAIIISGERSAILNFFLILGMTFLFVKKIRINILIFFGVSVLISTVLMTSIPHFKARMIDSTLLQLGLENLIPKEQKDEALHIAGGFEVNKINSLLDSQHGAHFLTAIEIWKLNKIFGSGLKTFRFMSPNDKFENIKSSNKQLRVATHPHNYYLEILSELGLLGLFFFLLIFSILVRNIFFMYKVNNLRENLSYFAPGIVALSFFWPLITTGSFFTNWIAAIFWFMFAMSVGLKYRLIIKNN